MLDSYCSRLAGVPSRESLKGAGTGSQRCWWFEARAGWDGKAKVEGSPSHSGRREGRQSTVSLLASGAGGEEISGRYGWMAPRWECSHASRGELMVLEEIRRCSYGGEKSAVVLHAWVAVAKGKKTYRMSHFRSD